MKLDMNFSFDTSVPNDGDVMKQVCAVLSGAPVKTVVADATEKKAVVIPDKVVEAVKEKVVEAVKENIAEETAAPTEAVEEAGDVQGLPAIDPLTSSEDDMMKVSTDVLLKILKGLKIDPNATEGKNTNAKLRRLILDWRKTQAPSTAASSSDDAEQDEAPAAAPAATTAKKMTYDEAKVELGPYFVNTKCPKYGTWRAGCQEFMKQHGACIENEDGTKTPKLSALGDADYTPLVNAIKDFYKL